MQRQCRYKFLCWKCSDVLRVSGCDSVSCVDFFLAKMERTMLKTLSKYIDKMNPEEAARRIGVTCSTRFLAAVLKKTTVLVS